MGFSFDPGEPSKTKILKKTSQLIFFKNFLMTHRLIRNNLRKKELVVIESKQKLQSFVLPHPHSIFLLLTLYFLRKVSMNYNIRFQKVFVMPKIYVLGLCDHIQFKILTVMHVCIVAQVLLISSLGHSLHFISHVKI